mmetsp:Transcript_31572/g.100665  ORF Transcript_31572/g.100665 Transcript_31572/m.100665 type:complete len:432 (-) Transcript_31572:1981-3276(-)
MALDAGVLVREPEPVLQQQASATEAVPVDAAELLVKDFRHAGLYGPHARGRAKLVDEAQEGRFGERAPAAWVEPVLLRELGEGCAHGPCLVAHGHLLYSLGALEVRGDEGVDDEVQEEHLRQHEEGQPQEARGAVDRHGRHEDVHKTLGCASEEHGVNAVPQGLEARAGQHGLPLQDEGHILEAAEDREGNPGKEQYHDDEEDRGEGKLPHHSPIEDAPTEPLDAGQQTEEARAEDEAEAHVLLVEGESGRIEYAAYGEEAAQQDVSAAVVLNANGPEVQALKAVLQEKLPEDQQLDGQLGYKPVARGQVPDARKPGVAPVRHLAPLGPRHPCPEVPLALAVVTPGWHLHELEQHEAGQGLVVPAARTKGAQVLAPSGGHVLWVLGDVRVVDAALELPGCLDDWQAAWLLLRDVGLTQALLIGLNELALEG